MKNNISDREAHARAMMIWREMSTVYGDEWIKVRGNRLKTGGWELSYVARTWIQYLDRFDIKTIRSGINDLGCRIGEKPISIFEFREFMLSRNLIK